MKLNWTASWRMLNRMYTGIAPVKSKKTTVGSTISQILTNKLVT